MIRLRSGKRNYAGQVYDGCLPADLFAKANATAEALAKAGWKMDDGK